MDNLPPVFQRALAPFAPASTAHGIKRTGLAKLNGAHLSEAPNAAAFAVEFVVEGARYSLAQMLADNADDTAFCEWASAARPGEFFPGVLSCQCVAAGELSEAELLAVDRALQQRKDAECKTFTRGVDAREMLRDTFGSDLDRATWKRT